jgi:hypothetical protein
VLPVKSKDYKHYNIQNLKIKKMKKSVPNLPASSKLQPPSGGGGPQIKNALKAKALAMSGGVPSKGKITGAGKGVAKKLVKKAK